MRTLKENRGFTLIELLVVIAIIGLLSSVILASLNSARLKSRDARRLSDIKELQTALALYFDDQSIPAYPTTLSAMQGAQIPKIPLDPKTGVGYGYTRSASLVDYTLGTNLENTSNRALSSSIGSGTAGSGTTLVTCGVGVGYCVKP